MFPTVALQVWEFLVSALGKLNEHPLASGNRERVVRLLPLVWVAVGPEPLEPPNWHELDAMVAAAAIKRALAAVSVIAVKSQRNAFQNQEN